MALEIDEIINRLAGLGEGERRSLSVNVLRDMAASPFTPSPGPQTDAYFSRADVLLFGGNPGGGKTALGVGLALNEHFRSLVLRRQFADLEGIIDTAKKLTGESRGYVGGGRPKYRKPKGGVIHFAGVDEDNIDRHQGVDHDYIYVDEAAQFPEKIIRMLMGWLRTDKPGQRCRIVLGSNPPLNSVGDWMVSYFAPWLDPQHPNPAEPGELRWYIPGGDDGLGEDKEVPEGTRRAIKLPDKTLMVKAQSRTFIPSSFTDNPFYDPEEYAQKLAGLPQEVRHILTTGDFMASRQDDPWQVFPTPWLKAAQDRWSSLPPSNVPMTTIAADVAQGGADNTVIAKRYDGWYAPLVKVPGAQTPDGHSVAGLIVAHRTDSAEIVIDMGGGYGGAVKQSLKDNGLDVHAHRGADGSSARTEDGSLGFANKRSEVIWRFREALQPGRPGGSPVCLPDDPELIADLTALTYDIGPRGVQVKSKKDVVGELQRSTDKGDAVIMAWAYGPQGWGATLRGGLNRASNARPNVVLGHSNRKTVARRKGF